MMWHMGLCFLIIGWLIPLNPLCYKGTTYQLKLKHNTPGSEHLGGWWAVGRLVFISQSNRGGLQSRWNLWQRQGSNWRSLPSLGGLCSSQVIRKFYWLTCFSKAGLTYTPDSRYLLNHHTSTTQRRQLGKAASHKSQKNNDLVRDDFLISIIG